MAPPMLEIHSVMRQPGGPTLCAVSRSVEKRASESADLVGLDQEAVVAVR